MIDSLRVDAAATAEWPDLVDELDRWDAAGHVAALWWRDDDAVAATRQLDALLRLAAGVPLGLAVIPALVRPDLAAALAHSGPVAVLQHGWQHANHAGDGKKSEYPKGRPAAVVGAEIGGARARLTSLFGTRALPVFVPPWNRIGDDIVPLLREYGMAALSAMAARRSQPLPAGLASIDVHVDVVCWRGDRGFIGAGLALGRLVGVLRAARMAEAVSRPIGILTHHLLMDQATAAFLERLVGVTRSHRAARWAGAGEFLP
jgi:hypothetical protein